MKRGWTVAIVAAGALASAGCSSDPAFWDSVNAGLNQLNDELAWETENCYWAPPPGMSVGQQKYCPGDVGYRDFYIPPESPYWRGRRGQDRRDGHDRPRDRYERRRD